MGMPELALDNRQRDPVVRHLDSVRVAELVRREPAPHSRCGGGPAQLAARGCRLPVAPGGRTVDHAEQRADREPDTELLPGLEVLPRPAVHPHLATLVAFAVADQHSPAASDQRAQTRPIGPPAGGAHHGDDLLDGGRVCWVAPALVAGRAAGVIAGRSDGLAPVASCIKADRYIEHLRGESRSRGRHDGRQPPRALTLWRRAGPAPTRIARCEVRAPGWSSVQRVCTIRRPEPRVRSRDADRPPGHGW